jgi:alpha-methylacyl-CoA racemase
VSGPLEGITVVELAAIGPGPFAAMILGDMGARVVRVDRPGGQQFGDSMLRSRAGRVEIDLKDLRGSEVVLRLVETADVILEGFRPGVAERLGVGPTACLKRNPRLVYGRISGWGQDGPRAGDAGHDIDYLAVSGTLGMIGPPDRPPPPPLNLVADFGGGGMLLVAGVLAALLERGRSGQGQVVDAAMVEGAALLATMLHEWLESGLATEDRGANLLDGGAPFYRCYRTADGEYMAVGALEPRFYGALIERLGLAGRELPDQYDRSGWGTLGRIFAEVFAGKTRDQWVDAFAGADACVAPVLRPEEARRDPHAVERGSFVDVDGAVVPAPAPRFSRTRVEVEGSPAADPGGVLAAAGLTADEIGALIDQGVVGPGPTNSPAARQA